MLSGVISLFGVNIDWRGRGKARNGQDRESRSQKSALIEFLWFQDFNLEFSFLEDFCPMDPTPNTDLPTGRYIFFKKPGIKTTCFPLLFPKSDILNEAIA